MGLVGLESHAPVPFLDKATSSITPAPCRAGTDDALLHYCLLTRQNVMFIQGFGGEKEGKQAKAGTIQVPEYVSGAICNLGVFCMLPADTATGRTPKMPLYIHIE